MIPYDLRNVRDGTVDCFDRSFFVIGENKKGTISFFDATYSHCPSHIIIANNKRYEVIVAMVTVEGIEGKVIGRAFINNNSSSNTAMIARVLQYHLETTTTYCL